MRQTETTALRGVIFLFLAGLISVGILSCSDSATQTQTDEAVKPDPETMMMEAMETPGRPDMPDIDEFKPLSKEESAHYSIQSSHPASTIQKLGTLGGIASFGYGNNDQGQVVGFSYTTSGPRHAFLWDASSGMTDLGALAGGNFSQAWDVNNQGQVVGYSVTPSGTRAFLWEAGTMTGLGTIGGNFSRAFGINDQEQVVGYSRTSSGQYHAFLWENGTMTDLGTLGGNLSIARDINNQGQVVGYSRTSSGHYHAFLWENGTMTDLGTLGGNLSIALGINDQGQVVGRSRTSSGTRHPFLWESGIMTDLGTLGGFYGEGWDINDQGQVVGWSYTSTGYRGFLWDAADGMQDLGSLNATYPYSRAHSIGNNGQIAGFSINNSGAAEAVIWSAQIDNTPPEISYTLEAESLWPPNHKMVLALSGIAAVDDVDGPVTPTVDVSSNEVPNGKGDGNTGSDWTVVDNGDGTFDVYLRAERSGRGGGRTYTVTISAEDAAGNTAEKTAEVTVAHDQGR